MQLKCTYSREPVQLQTLIRLSYYLFDSDKQNLHILSEVLFFLF